MRAKISFLQFIISILIGIYAFIMIIYIEANYISPKQLFFMTMWNCFISTIYLITISICDFSFFYIKSNKLEKLNEFFRETLSPAFTALTYLVTFTFWVMIFPVLVKSGNGNFGLNLYTNLYVHLILTIFQTVDIFFSYRKNKGIIMKYDFLIAAFIMGSYAILTLILVYGYNYAVYPFLKHMTWYKGLGELILFEVMMFLFYLIHVGFIKLKYKYKIYILMDGTNESDILENIKENEYVN